MVLDLTVVADPDCSTSQTYLAYLAAAGLKVREVVEVEFTYGQSPSTPQRTPWRRRIRRRMRGPELTPRRVYDSDYYALCEAVQEGFPLRIDYGAAFPLGDCAEVLSSLVVSDFDDPRLHRFLARRSCPTFLYTAGGRVPATLLRDPGMRFIHVHPGVVPQIRGSDGLLWSILVRGAPGASCFYMDEGIDTGAVIATKEFEHPDFRALRSEMLRDGDRFYQVLMHAYDPHLRALTLLDAIGDGSTSMARLPAEPQDPVEGRQYFAMHPKLRDVVFSRLSGG